MKALAHLTLLSLLFVTSANQSTSNGTTTSTTPAPSLPTTAPTTPPNSTVSVSSTVPNSNVTPTESKPNTTAKTPSAAANTTLPSSNSSSASPTTNGSAITPSTQSNSSEVVTPGTSSNVTSSEIITPSHSPTVPSNPCQGAPCKDGSLCVSLNNTHFCLCSLGYYYNSSTCTKGTIFPGSITVKVLETSGLGNGNSMPYQKLHIQITDFFKNAFNNSDYGQTVIDGVSISPSASSEVRADSSDVVVEVLNIFTETTKETAVTVSASITKAIESSRGEVLTYTPQNPCDYYGCEKENEQDDCRNGLLCKCKPGMERPNPQVPVCVASAPNCPDTCSADHNKQCVVNKDGNGECVCLPGYKKGDGEICQECAFGSGGVDCEDKFQLILTIVGSIGGALILCLVIALIVSASSKNKNKNIEEQNLIENDFQNLRLRQTTTGFSNPGVDGSIFPKVRANVSGQPQNPYAHQRSMPRPDY